MYRDISPALLHVIEPVASSHGLEIVDASVNQGPGRTHVQVVLDTPQGDGRVTLGACAGVSREIGTGLDADDLFNGAYTLEVCSPGVDRALGREVDFERAVGQQVQLETRERIGGSRRFKGRLAAFEAGEARVEIEADSVCIPFSGISKANAFYPFDSRSDAEEAEH
jgi:ribosome maturation factor RimP